MDITQLILEDHHEQRRLFSVLDDIASSDVGRLEAVWTRLSHHLEAHVEAEERHFYPELLRLGKGPTANSPNSSEDETEDAIKDHNEIRDGMAAVAKEQIGSQAWLAAVAAVNKANSEHMGEEEREGLTDFRRHATLEIRHELGLTFAAFEASHIAGVPSVDKDPATYIAEHE